MIHAEMYVKNYEEMKEKNIGYLFWGGVGTGKTFMAACIANALLDKCCTVKMTNFATIINDLFSCEDKSAYIDALVKYDLLIIDDLGAERNTESAVENVFNVINRRYRTGKPLIITTNLHLKMITGEQAVDKRRIYDRILELCTPVCVDGASKKAKTSKDKMDQLKEMSKKYKEDLPMSNYEIPYWKKYTLSIEEAASYFRIGEGKLRKMVSENPYAEYLLWNGNRVQIKREKFEAFVDTLSAV
ncbi:excisionase [Lachnospiraceae bacterium LCP25S3_G4]